MTTRWRNFSTSSKATCCSSWWMTATSTMFRFARARFSCCRRTCGTRRNGRRKARSGEAARPNDFDAFEWYCFECQALVHRIELKVEPLVKDRPPLYDAFYADQKARTCKNCGAIHPGKKAPAGWVKM